MASVDFAEVIWLLVPMFEMLLASVVETVDKSVAETVDEVSI